MQFLLDHIASILVSGAVLLLVIATNLGAQRAAVEETIAYAAKVQTLNLADFLENDLLLIGDCTSDTIEDVATNSDGQTTEFSFWREDDMGVDMLVSYTLTETDSVEIDDEWIQLYRLDRTENGVAAGGGQGSGGNSTENSVSFQLKTKDLFSGFEDIVTAPDEIDFSNLNSLFRLAEATGVGETVANPSVTVQSGQKGDIQIGSDVPVQIRDTFGNISTQYFKTGIIIDVTPTLIEQPLADTLGAPVAEFLHLNVKVEKSGSRPSASGPTIDRSLANTQLLLLDGEQTVIGGLYSTEESISRRGVPFLKDLPRWFFGLRYVFGRTQRSVTQKELVISLEANVVDPIRDRMARKIPDNLLESQRESVRRALDRFDTGVSEAAGNSVETRNY